MGGGKRGKNSGSKSPSSEEGEEVAAGTTKSSTNRKPRSRSQNDLNDYYFGERFARLRVSPTVKVEAREIERRSRSSTVDWTTSPRQYSTTTSGKQVFDNLVFKKKNFKGEGVYEGYLTLDGKRSGAGSFKGGDFIYEGKWEDDKPHGYGVHRNFSSGDRYEGGYQQGKRHGLGVFLWGNGDKYTGSFAKGYMDGLGRFEWSDGNVYQGQWKKGQIQGEGCLIVSDGTISEGHFCGGLLHGYAKKTWVNGDMYQGCFHHDNLHGYGVYYWSDGHRYEGLWKNGNHHGIGHYTTAIQTLAHTTELTHYIGEFRDGAQLGLSKVAVEGGDSIYFGESNNLIYSNESEDCPASEVCWGRIQYNNGILYEGECREYVKEGHGILRYDRILLEDSEQKKAFCSMSHLSMQAADCPNERAILREIETLHLLIRSMDPIELSLDTTYSVYDIIYIRGGMYVGDFHDDEPHGEGDFYLSNGQNFHVHYDHGRLLAIHAS